MEVNFEEILDENSDEEVLSDDNGCASDLPNLHTLKTIEQRRFLEDAREIVLEQVRDAMERHDSVKVNTAFNGEFVANDKRATKSIKH
ncbi:hypothetical protein ALC60_08604 [Trachymyrmex zeteki]|uniref:Uncharacterized protein n=1 Tax=Mycetomoellerius zeteki TaxID=64791 RepID=A0A151WWF7_9HYME|nr:hypothetical protein ALC60_08604 [Trachymyrmex zeteki]